LTTRSDKAVVGYARTRAALGHLFLICAGLLLAGCVASPDAPPVPRPDVKAGDCWTYRRVSQDTGAERGTYALCATFASKDVIHVIARFPGTADTDWTWTSHWNPVTYPNGIQTTDAGLLNFPLREGQTYDATWVDESFSIGMRSTHRRTVHVTGWEDVVVPAGKFRALRLEAEGDYIRKWGGIDRTDAGAARNVIWYVPEVRRWVKRLDAGSDVGGERSQILEELVTFSLQ
jgi:hypothetical protein